MSRKLARHACADHIHGLRHRSVNDTMPCTCGRMYTLRLLTLAVAVTTWFRTAVECIDSDQQVWVRNRAAERAARRERILREREWRRG